MYWVYVCVCHKGMYIYRGNGEGNYIKMLSVSTFRYDYG